MAEPYQRNAADRQQRNTAARREKRDQAELHGAFKAVVNTAAGRAVMRELLGRAGVFRSVYESSSKIYYNAGRQDFGHELQALFYEVDEEAYHLMEREYRARLKRVEAEVLASRTPAADDEEQNR